MTFIYRSFINIAILLCLTLLLAQTALAQAVFQGSFWSEFPGGAKAVCADDDIDNDNDGLIELCYLEDVNAIRYNLEGTSYKDSMDATGVATGCPLSGGEEKCEGYELVRDIDFDDDDSYSSATNIVKWTTGEGWRPIGDSTNSFTSIFEGNGHTIANLTINRSRTDHVGLFGYTGSGSKISNIGLLNVDIDGNVDTDGEGRVGGLVGQNDGSIANSYAAGSVDASRNVGGLVGWNSGNIANSYATGSITGGEQVGGLVGRSGGSIANNYATASLKARDDVDSLFGFGGLVGLSLKGIINSYATGFIDTTGATVSGLCGFCFNSAENSYWDTSTTRVSTSFGSDDDGKTTVVLQEPTGATGIYSSWSTENWDFGTEMQYPALKHAHIDANNPACRRSDEHSQQPVCGTLLRGQERNYQPRIIDPKNNDEIRISKSEADMTKTISVTVFDDNTDDELTLFLSAVAGKNLVVLETTKTPVMMNDKFKRDINKNLSIKAPQEVISGVTTLQLVAVDGSGSDNAMSKPILLQVLVGNIQPKIMPIDDIELRKGTSTTLTVVVEDADDDLIDVSLDTNDSEVAEVVKATDDAGRTFQITALNKGMAMITVTADDGQVEANSITTATFTVKVLLNKAPVIDSVMPAEPNYNEGEQVSITANASDANHDDLTYTWSVTSKDKNPRTLTEATKTNDGLLSFDVPAHWVVKASTATGVTETLQLEVTVSDGNLSVTQTTEVVVTKINNGNADIPSISVNPDNPNEFTFRQIVLSQDKDGVNDSPNLKYRWQHCPANTNCSSNWQDIGSLITDTTNALSLDLSGFGVGDRFRVKITYTDGQGYNENLLSGEKTYTADSAVKVHIKVFLEGPLQ